MLRHLEKELRINFSKIYDVVWLWMPIIGSPGVDPRVGKMKENVSEKRPKCGKI